MRLLNLSYRCSSPKRLRIAWQHLTNEHLTPQARSPGASESGVKASPINTKPFLGLLMPDFGLPGFFYVPNLIIVELMIQARDRSKNVRVRNVASASMIVASIVLVIATWGFARVAWIPAIAEWAVG